MTLLDTPTRTTAKGVVGARQLVAVQTIDIARLPIQPVAITPSTFVAVSGWGPNQGSNESGKTSFQAAVALLCGDPEWWRSTGGVWAVGLLFAPDVAGDGTGTIDAARFGYVVGVFADPDSPGTDPLTLWLRISAESPHLTARWGSGVHFAKNWEGAEDVWRRLPPGSEVGARRYLETMFGGSNRCLAWVTKRGTQPSQPSLLSMTVDKRKPHEIGADLLAVTGRAGMLDREKDQRSAAADAVNRLAAQREAGGAIDREEDERLQEIERRNLARQRLARGQRAWELHFARGLLDIRYEIANAILRRRQARALAETADAAHQEALNEVAALGDGSHLADDVEGAQRSANEAQGQFSATVVKRAAIGQARDQQTIRARDLADLARLWDQTPLAELEVAELRSRNAVQVAQREVTIAEVFRDQAQELIDRLTSGGGPAMAALSSASVGAVTLGDAIVVDDRARWEPLLHPWKEAVVVADIDLPRATSALSRHPGAIVVHGPSEGDTAMPPGVTSAPVESLPFLRALDAGWQSEELPERVASGHAQIIGGWSDQQLGADARRASALADLQVAIELLEGAEAMLATARLRLRAHEDQLKSARAHDDRQAALGEISRLDDEFAAADGEVSDATRAFQLASDAVVAARTAQQFFQQRKDAAQREAESEEARSAQAAAEAGRHDREAQELRERMLSYWDVGWARPWREARTSLQDEGANEVSSFRKDASESLLGALQALRIDIQSGRGAPNDAVRSVVDRRKDLDNEETDRLRAPFPFDRVAGPVIHWLAEWEETDRLLPERLATDRARRARDLATLDREVSDQSGKLSDLRDALERDIERIFQLISDRYDQLDRRYGGFGARLSFKSIPPAGTDDPWVWQVEPQWKRSSTGRFVSYTRQMNDAQGKQHTIHLVLAALIATDNPAGRLLILDELGDKLDTENQRSLLEEIADVARTERVTVLGTCQDWLLDQAAQIGAIGEVIWFEYASKADLLNRPTRMWGYDENRERVLLTADDLLIDRPLL